MTLDFDKGNGLIPAIVQDNETEQVLMLAYMNAESYAKTLETKKVTFFSRSRQELWTKGETSGNVLDLVSMTPDCDNDTLLVRARPAGPTCHLGNVTCFTDDAPEGLGFLAYLERVIAARKSESPDTSYTAKLLQSPIKKVAQKVGEEGVETALAAVGEDDTALLGEAADLLYHLSVLLNHRDLSLSDVMAVLKERHGA